MEVKIIQANKLFKAMLLLVYLNFFIFLQIKFSGNTFPPSVAFLPLWAHSIGEKSLFMLISIEQELVFR